MLQNFFNGKNNLSAEIEKNFFELKQPFYNPQPQGNYWKLYVKILKLAIWSSVDQIFTKNVLRAEFNELTRWFYENYMTLNADKCHFLCFRKYTANETSISKNSVMKNSKKILGITIDNKLNCKSHIKD